MSAETIMIVEDDRDQMLGLAVRLRANGYQVVCAADGTTAFTQASKTVPDLIILDIGLPAGDGFKVLEWLGGMATTVTIPVIVLSGRDPCLARDGVQPGAGRRHPGSTGGSRVAPRHDGLCHRHPGLAADAGTAACGAGWQVAQPAGSG